MRSIKLHTQRMSLPEAIELFMQQGFPPIKIVRRALLQDDSLTL